MYFIFETNRFINNIKKKRKKENEGMQDKMLYF